MLIKIDIITFNYMFNIDIISATVGTIVWLVNGHCIFWVLQLSLVLKSNKINGEKRICANKLMVKMKRTKQLWQ